MKTIEEITQDIHHTALALELPAMVYNDYTNWLAQTLKARDEELVETIIPIPESFPLKESDEYDRGFREAKIVILNIINNRK